LTTLARTAFAAHVRLYDTRDQLRVQAEARAVQLAYVSVRAGETSPGATYIQCRMDRDYSQMWITFVQVAGELRRQGLGRDMVRAAEATARAAGLHTIRVFPVMPAIRFWKSLGYTPDDHTSRVLQKRLQ
jgi:GNAT superfamily N-acetyltransferase